jgi:hypothetical protein
MQEIIIIIIMCKLNTSAFSGLTLVVVYCMENTETVVLHCRLCTPVLYDVAFLQDRLHKVMEES